VDTNPNQPSVSAAAPPAQASRPPVAAPTPPSQIQSYADYVPETPAGYVDSLPPSSQTTRYPVPAQQPAAATVAERPRPAPRRSASYYIMLGLAALALFALSMFVTILVLG
jgi:hypothetical protein